MIMNDEQIIDDIFFALKEIEPFYTAREVGEKYSITVQKASGMLRKLENKGIICAKRIQAGRNELKTYFLP